ncbi:MAG: hypothetical protein R3F59_06540 [Myxococcota bacterium]
MASINFATREIAAKVVYFGATGAGCNTNLERLHALLDVKSKSGLQRFGPAECDERSLFFAYRSPEPPPVASFEVALSVYSLPGAISLPAFRDEVLREVDGVVLVADARGPRNPENVEALLELETLLGGLGLDISDLPVVLQVNHVDAEDARPVSDVVFDLNPFGFPVVQAVARDDEGVVATHHEVVAAMTGRIANALSGQTPGLRLTALHDPHRPTELEVVQEHMERFTERSAATPAVEEVLQEELDSEALEAMIEALPPGPAVEVAFQPRELVGSHPAKVLGAEVRGDGVHLELLMERLGGSDQRRLTVVLVNRPTDIEPVPRIDRASPPAEEEEVVDDVFDYLPQDDEELAPVAAPPEDLPPVWYGVLGVGTGVLIGLLAGYLLQV